MLYRLSVLVFVVLVSCASGPQRVSLVTSPSGAEGEATESPALLDLRPGTQLLSIDGQAFRYRRFLEVELPAGDHVAVFHYVDNKQKYVGLQLMSLEPVTVEWTSEPGHVYRLRAEIARDGEGDAAKWPWTGEVVDVTDEEATRIVGAAVGVGLMHLTRNRWTVWSRGTGCARVAVVTPTRACVLMTLLACVASGCSGEGSEEAPPALRDDLPPTAKLDVERDLRAARDAPKHPSDGGGSAELVLAPGERAEVVARRGGRWTLRYIAGPHGIADGGFVRLTVPRFWDWTPAQTQDEQYPGYATATTDAAGVTLTPRDAPSFWVDFVVSGRALVEGEALEIVYGAGPAGARADKYAETGSRFWISVDGDGDGIAAQIAESPAVDVLPGPPAQLVLVVPSTAEPGDTVPLRLSLLDALGSAGTSFEGEVVLTPAEGLELPERLAFTSADRGTRRVDVAVQERGVFRIEARVVDAAVTIESTSNPLLVEPGCAPILWGDLHGHSNLSDGTGTPDEYLAYARDVAGLDVIALTDHDHWGMEFLDEHPELWEEIRAATERFHDPGRFVTLLGYEWTSWIHGHRHVLYGTDYGPVLSSIDEDYDTPTELWDALRGTEALTFAHHSAGGPVATNWKQYPPDPELEPVTEVASVHGQSEAPDGPRRIYSPLMGNFVRDVLDEGHQLGFVGSGDSHDGHPGLAHLVNPSGGGLAALLTSDVTREGAFAALRNRRCYATNGPRIVLRAALDGKRMGASLKPSGEPSLLFVRAIGTAPLERIDVIRSGRVAESLPAGGLLDVAATLELEPLKAGEYVYVRVVQSDRGAAWSSPFFLE
jgi:hypothetical protein